MPGHLASHERLRRDVQPTSSHRPVCRVPGSHHGRAHPGLLGRGLRGVGDRLPGVPGAEEHHLRHQAGKED